MVIRVVEFSSGGTKLETFLPEIQQTQMKIIEWCIGECQKLGIILENKVI